MYTLGGDLPRWPLANGYTGCMDGTIGDSLVIVQGQHAEVVIADTYLKGITNFDVSTAYQAMKLAATTERKHAGRSCLQNYLNNGCIQFQQSIIHFSVVPYDCDTHGACSVLKMKYSINCLDTGICLR